MSDRRRILSKFERAWDAQPDLSFGQLVENVENTAWDLVAQRHCSARLANLPDQVLEMALDKTLSTQP